MKARVAELTVCLTITSLSSFACHLIIPNTLLSTSATATSTTTTTAESMSRFAGRGLDLFYFIFFIWHIPISLCVDFQAIYPPAIMAVLQRSTPLPGFIEWYKTWSRDPIIVNAAVGGWEWDWIRGFMWVEALFQMPCWIIGAWCLWHSTFATACFSKESGWS